MDSLSIDTIKIITLVDKHLQSLMSHFHLVDFQIYHTNSILNIQKNLSNNEFNIAIIDIKYLLNIKETIDDFIYSLNKTTIKLILPSDNSDVNFMSLLLNKGFDGILTVPIYKTLFHTQIHSFFKKSDTYKKTKLNDFNSIIQHVDDILYSVDLNGIIKFIGPQVEKYGYTVNELMNTSIFKLLHRFDVEKITNILSIHKEKGEDSDTDIRTKIRVKEKNGEYIWFEERGHLIFDDQSNCTGIAGILRDLTQQHKVESELMTNKKMYFDLIEKLPGFIYRCKFDSSWTMLYLSPGIKSMTGYEPEEIVQNREITYRDIIHPLEREHIYNEVESCIIKNVPFEISYRIIKKDKTVIWVWEQGKVIYSGSKKLIYLEGFVTEITSLKKQESELKKAIEQVRKKNEESNALYRAAKAILSDELLQNILQELFSSCKTYLKAQFGCLSLLNSENFDEEIIHIEDNNSNCKIKTHYPDLYDFIKEKVLENEKVVTNNDYIGPIDQDENFTIHNYMFAPVILHEKVIGILGYGNKNDSFTNSDKKTLHGFTELASIAIEKKQTIVALEESEDKYKKFVSFSPISIILLNSSAQILEMNDAAIKLCGYNFHEIQSKNISILFPEEESYRNTKFLNKITKTATAHDEVTLRHKEGQNVYIDIQAIKIGSQNTLCYCNDITFKKIASIELKKYKTQLESIVAQRTKELRDKITELNLFQKKLETAYQKEKELGEFKSNIVSTVSHEFRTPLSIVKSSSELLKMYFSDFSTEKVQKHFYQINLSIGRMTELIENMLRISEYDTGNDTIHLAPIDLKLFFENLIENLLNQNKGAHKINVLFETNINKITADKVMLEQVFSNIISNAMKYSPSKSDVDFQITDSKDTIIFKITDYGIGVSEDEQDKIFTKFYRSENAKDIQGTGLGLSITKRYVELHKGKISVFSKKNEGTTFIVEIPLIQ